MKQKNTAIGKAFLCGSAAILLLAGCVKESAINEKYRPAGTPITFSATTGYENGTGTRTEYSGQLYGNTPKYERIDWLSGDPVTITYVHGTPATSQYQVTEVSGTTDKNSYASVEVASGQTKLTWGEGEGDHTFYAMYPSTDFQGNGTASLTSSNHVQGSVPATQTLHSKSGKYLPPMQYGYMVAYKNIGGTSTESRVTLPFTPAVTAFEFKLQRAQDDTGNLKIKGAELTATTPLTGSFAFDITGGDDNGATWNTSIGTNATTVTDEGHTVSFTFPVEGGVSLPDYGGETFLDFTLFALPVEQTGLRLKLIYTDDSENVLALNDAPDVPHTFEAARKHVITNKSVPGDWEYVIEATDPDIFPYTGGTQNATVTSYRQKGNVKEPVAWTVEGYYYDAACTQPVAPADLWITSFGTNGTGEGSVTGESVPVEGQPSVPVMTETITPEAQALNALIANAPSQGSAGNYMNLSNPMDMTSPYIKESANSYIVNATGYYRIPLVMGNSIKNNAPNPDEIAWKGFDGAAVDGGVYKNDWRVLFENYKGNHITDPWLKNQGGTPTSAEIVWEDVEGLVKTDGDYNLQNAISSDGNWLQFQIPAVRTGEAIYPDATTGVLRNEPRQGNAVIAVKDETGTVMWSYHIWVTDYVPKNYPGFQTANDVRVSIPLIVKKEGTDLLNTSIYARMSGRNLGFIVYGQTITSTYPAYSSLYVRIKQDDSDEMRTVAINQEQYVDNYTRDIGNPTCQLARNSLFWPIDNINSESSRCYGKSPVFQTLQGPKTLGESIQSPGFAIVTPTGSDPHHLKGISVVKPDPIHAPANSENYDWWPQFNTYMSRSLPSNLWNANSRMNVYAPFPGSQDAQKWIAYGWRTEAEGSNYLWINPAFRSPSKSVYDPSPVGYMIPSLAHAIVLSDYSIAISNPIELYNSYSLQIASQIKGRKIIHNNDYYHYYSSNGDPQEFALPNLDCLSTTGNDVPSNAYPLATSVSYWKAIGGIVSSSPMGCFTLVSGEDRLSIHRLNETRLPAVRPVADAPLPPVFDADMILVEDYVAAINDFQYDID